jgi:heme/copper-type cytochrome/quinol oxidase subunit 2
MQASPNTKFKYITFALVICFFLISNVANSQCAMCRASLESSGKTTQVEAVNDGIVYLMAIPYILVAAMGIFIYRLYTKRK